MKPTKQLIQVDKSHYAPIGYDSKGRFVSYWHQIHEVMNLNLKSVLEVGIGNKFLNNFMKNYGKINVTSVDVDKELEPDICASVNELPLRNRTFECAVCFQTLEHLPFKKFKTALFELSRVSKKWMIISLPDQSRCVGLKIYFKNIPIRSLQKIINIPAVFPAKHIFDGEHYWEIGKRGYSLKKIEAIFPELNLKLIKTFRVFEKPSHRFFILCK
ncbi:methyltransferase domain-containing protein [candidate division WOR-3 bacterium]|nr:methyltransferase domain-containing protein [candidate division WOR-3 bacterium]